MRDLLRTVANEQHGDSHTHVSLYGPHALWTVRPDTQAPFWSGYCGLVDKKMNGDAPEPYADMCLAKKPNNVMPVITKFTFRFHSNPNGIDGWEPYDDHFLHWLCHTYQSVISEFFDMVSETNLELTCAVLESTNHWYEDDPSTNQRQMVMEVRLQFPYCHIDASIQNRFIRPRVIQMLCDGNIISKLQRTPIGDWENIISSTIVNEPVPMYGSTRCLKTSKTTIDTCLDTYHNRNVRWRLFTDRN